MHKYLRLAAAIIICQMAGIIGSVFTAPNIAAWYATLNKPALTPPNWLFGPVWVTLYTLMGTAVWRIWEKRTKKKANKEALYPFAAQLALNALWSMMFFGLRNPLYGLMTIVPLWLITMYTILKFYKIDKTAAYLLVPYILWVTVATYLNFMVWLLN
ncbi:MAG: TspO/MBR family protein [Candidatus Aenigmatarchaeota archaeon]